VLKAILSADAAGLARLAPVVFQVSLPQWKQLCEHEDARVRDAAAGASAEHSDLRHWSTVMPILVEMCNDDSSQVRLSAITAIARHDIRVQDVYSDFERKPTGEELARLRDLVIR